MERAMKFNQQHLDMKGAKKSVSGSGGGLVLIGARPEKRS